MGIVIPQYEARESVDPGTYPVRQLHVNDSVGQALSSVGDTISAVSQRAQALQDQTDRMHAELGLQAASNAIGQKAQFLQENAPADGAGLEQSVASEAVDPSIAAYKASITNPKLKDEFGLRADLLAQQHLNLANDAEYKLRNGFSSDTADKFAVSDGQTIQADPTQFSAAQSAYADKVNALPYLTSAQKAAKIEAFNQNSAALLGKTLHDQDPQTLYFMTPHPEVPADKFDADRQAYIGGSLVKSMIAQESAGNPTAVSPKGASGLMQIMPGTAVDIAKALGDKAFLAAPPTVRADMLQDPKVNVAYGSYYINKLLKDNGGDLQLALIAYNAGQERADSFKAAGGDWSKMGVWAKETQPYVRNIIGGMGTSALAATPGLYDTPPASAEPVIGTHDAPASPQASLPIVTGTQPGRLPLNMNGVRPEVLSNWQRVQGALGFQVPIVSAYRDPHTNLTAGGAKSSQHLDGNAIDLDVSKLPLDKRVALIKSASAAGFTGIGVYANSIHLDMRASGPAVWGPSHHSDSVPGWATAALETHVAGGFKSGLLPGAHNILVQAAGGGTVPPPAVLPVDAGGGIANADTVSPPAADTVATTAPAGPRPYVSSLFKDLSPVTLQELSSGSAATLAKQSAMDGGALDQLKAQTDAQAKADIDSINQSGAPVIKDQDMPAFSAQYLQLHGAEALQKYQQDRAAARQVHDLTKDLSTMTPEQQQLLLKNITPQGGPNAAAQQQVYDEVQKRVNETVSATKAATEAAAAQAKAANDQVAGSYVQRMLKNDPNDIAKLKDDIANDPALSWETRMRLSNTLSHQAGNGANDIKKYGDGFWDAFKGITAQPDDPKHITDAAQILKRAGPGGDLTLAGADKLISVMNQSRRSVNDASVTAAKTGMMNYAKQNLSFDQETISPYMPPLKDPKGQAIFNSQFIPKFEAAYDQWVKDGKDPWQFLTKDNVDKMITGLRPQSQMQADRLAAGAEGAGLTPDAKPPETAVPDAPKGVDAGGWSTVIQTTPYTTGGTPMDTGKWAGAVDYLRQHPDEQTKKFFNDKFGKSGVDADTILKQLVPKVEEVPVDPLTTGQ